MTDKVYKKEVNSHKEMEEVGGETKKTRTELAIRKQGRTELLEIFSYNM